MGFRAVEGIRVRTHDRRASKAGRECGRNAGAGAGDPNLFQKEGIDQFKGAENDTISVAVEGVLPFQEYAWRNDRSRPIVLITGMSDAPARCERAPLLMLEQGATGHAPRSINHGAGHVLHSSHELILRVAVEPGDDASDASAIFGLMVATGTYLRICR